MKKLFLPLIVIAICVIGFGFYRGWFVVSSNPSSHSNDVNVNLATDTEKMKEDAKVVTDKAAELTGNGNEELTKPVDRTPTAETQNPVPPDGEESQKQN